MKCLSFFLPFFYLCTFLFPSQDVLKVGLSCFLSVPSSDDTGGLFGVYLLWRFCLNFPPVVIVSALAVFTGSSCLIVFSPLFAVILFVTLVSWALCCSFVWSLLSF